MCRPGQRSRYSDSIPAGRTGDQIPIGSEISAPVQTGSGSDTASRTMDTGKRPGRKTDQSVPYGAEGKIQWC